MSAQSARNRWYGVVLVGLLSCGSVPAWAATITVRSTGDSGGCPATCTLRGALATAAAGDTINFTVTGVITLTSGQLMVNKNLTITGPGATLLAIDGNFTGRVMFVTAGVTASVSNLTIRNGNGYPYSGDDGGGIYNAGTLTLADTTVSGNRTGTSDDDFFFGGSGGSGGGIYNGGTLTLTNTTVSGNETGGGGFSHGSGGFGGSGGGIYNGGTLTLTNTTVSGNETGGGGVGAYGSGGDGGSGGGISNGGTLTLTNTTVSGNGTGGGGSGEASGGSGGSGGGISNGGTLTLTNTTVSGNGTGGSGGGGDGGFGGGIYNRGTLTLTNTTVSGNGTSDNGGGGSGGGIYNSSDATAVMLSNSIIANSAFGGDRAGNSIDASPGDNISSDLSCNLQGPTNQSNTNPQLGPLQDNSGPTQTHVLLPGSPALDGVQKACPPPSTDQRGVGRPLGSQCDIGAVEQGTFMCTYTVGPPNQVVAAEGGAAAPIDVTTQPGCTWTATSRVPWVTITSGNPGFGNGTVKYTVAANLGPSPRRGVLTVAGKSFIVSQRTSVPAPCIITVGPGSTTGPSGGSGSVAITASTGSCRWQARSQVPWITLTAPTTGSGSGAVGFTVQAGGPRKGRITVNGKRVTIMQN